MKHLILYLQLFFLYKARFIMISIRGFMNYLMISVLMLCFMMVLIFNFEYIFFKLKKYILKNLVDPNLDPYPFPFPGDLAQVE